MITSVEDQPAAGYDQGMGEPARQLDSPVHGAFSPAFWRALVSLPNEGVSIDAYAVALDFVARLAPLAPTEPDLSVVEGDVLRFTWFGPRYTMEVDVLSHGNVRWYFRDSALEFGRSEGSADAALVSLDALPLRFWQCVQTAGTHRGGR